MVVKTGYKNSEIGLIPKDWNVSSLGSMLATSPSYGINAAAIPYDSRFPTYLRITDISEDGRFIEEEKASVKHLLASQYILVDGDLVFARTGASVGKSYLYDVDDGELIFAGFLIRVQPDKNKLIPKYLKYFTHSKHFFRWVKVNSMRSGQPGINGQEFASLPLPTPPTVTEQKAIASVLSDADALIKSLEQLITKKRNIKQGAMQELLTGKKRLPGFSGKWNLKKLGDIADPNQKWSFTGGPFGSNLKSSEYIDDGVRIIQLQNIGDGEFHNESTVFTSYEKADELLSCNIYPGDIILSKMGDPVARACIVPHYHDRYLMCSDGIRLTIDQKKYSTYFVYLSINATDFRTRAANAGTGSTRKRIGLTELRNLELSCPGLPEQNLIANIIFDMDAELAELEQKLTKAKNIKQGMMQELLTGRTRLV
ncbi:restriction endonuclease subunit S [Nitrosomonas sp.]|uniref:restriction endonuclease subunit S n=1 Tax=Nitrosomonas sp. TaxID=42353 RepID=UPI00374D6A9E